MKAALDSSVIVSALAAADPDHVACRRLLLSERHSVFSHALSEVFSTLTGGRLGLRIPAADAASILRDHVVPALRIAPLDSKELLDAYQESAERGIRGGAIYDYLHLVAARRAGAECLYTLNLDDFLAFHRSGDPEIVAP